MTISKIEASAFLAFLLTLSMFSGIKFAKADIVKTVLFSEDFESADLNKWADISTFTPPPTGPVLTTTKYHGGLQSVYLPDAVSSDFWLVSPIDPPMQDFYWSYWAKMDNPPPSGYDDPVPLLLNSDANYYSYCSAYWMDWGGTLYWTLQVARNSTEEVGTLKIKIRSDIVVDDSSTSWINFTIHVQSGVSGSNTTLYIDNVEAAKIADGVPYSQQLDEIELSGHPSYFDDIEVYTLSASSPSPSPSPSPSGHTGYVPSNPSWQFTFKTEYVIVLVLIVAVAYLAFAGHKRH